MIQIGASAATIDSPIENLMACHRRIEQRLDTLVNAAGHLGSNRSAALAAIVSSLHFLDSSGVMHTADEEGSIFPRLRQKLSPSEVEYVDSLEAQHGEAEAIYAELKNLAHEVVESSDLCLDSINWYRDCAERLRTLYRAHIQSEDQILTVLAKRSLDELEIAAISQEMRERRQKSVTDPAARLDPPA